MHRRRYRVTRCPLTRNKEIGRKDARRNVRSTFATRRKKIVPNRAKVNSKITFREESNYSRRSERRSGLRSQRSEFDSRRRLASSRAVWTHEFERTLEPESSRLARRGTSGAKASEERSAKKKRNQRLQNSRLSNRSNKQPGERFANFSIPTILTEL